MKLWGWWNKDEHKPQPDVVEQRPKLLDQNKSQQQDPEATAALRRAAQPSVKETIKNIGADDFKNLNKIPCMRVAMLTGVGIGSTAGAVMFIARRPFTKVFNWAFAGFFIGSILSWEQCRFRRRQGKKNVVNARQSYATKGSE